MPNKLTCQPEQNKEEAMIKKFGKHSLNER
jgi:hypothetical protein